MVFQDSRRQNPKLFKTAIDLWIREDGQSRLCEEIKFKKMGRTMAMETFTNDWIRDRRAIQRSQEV